MKRLFLFLLVLIAILTIGVICCNLMVVYAAKGKMYDDISAIPSNRVGLLLGTSPKGRNGSPNPFYTNRIDACVALYQAGKIERILVSGDNSRTTYNEPISIKEDLVSAGIPARVIYLPWIDELISCRFLKIR